MKRLKLEMLATLALLIGLLAFGSGQAQNSRTSGGGDDDDRRQGEGSGAQLYVDDDRAQCPNAQYTSIQAAVNAAHPGDTVNVCPGTYREQVKIKKPLTVRGIAVANQNQAIIQPLAVVPNSTSLFSGLPISAIVLVDSVDRVTLLNLTIDGLSAAPSGCGTPDYIGVYYRNASGRIDSLAVRNIKLGAGSEGCQTGLGIFVQSGHGGSSRVDILNNSLHDYQKNGITANEAGTHISIEGNAISGFGESTIIAQNGIQVGFGADGEVESNSVINHIFTGCADPNTCGSNAAANILITGSDGVEVSHNTTGKAQLNIYYEGNKGEVSNNTIFETDVFDGITLIGNRNRATGNSIFNSQEAGVFVQGNKNLVNGNTINEAPVGILEGSPSSGNNYSGNRFFNTGMNIVPAPASAVSNATINTLALPTTVPAGRTVQPVRP